MAIKTGIFRNAAKNAIRNEGNVGKSAESRERIRKN